MALLGYLSPKNSHDFVTLPLREILPVKVCFPLKISQSDNLFCVVPFCHFAPTRSGSPVLAVDNME